MGLEAVELVLAVEDRFRVVLPDEEVSRARTVGDFVRVVEGVLPDAAAGKGVCASARVFYLLRRSLVERAGVRRVDVRPESELAELLPKSQRRGAWRNLRKSGIPLPRLTRRGDVPDEVRTVGAAVVYLETTYPTLAGVSLETSDVERVVFDVVAEQLDIARDRIGAHTEWSELGV